MNHDDELLLTRGKKKKKKLHATAKKNKKCHKQCLFSIRWPTTDSLALQLIRSKLATGDEETLSASVRPGLGFFGFGSLRSFGFLKGFVFEVFKLTNYSHGFLNNSRFSNKHIIESCVAHHRIICRKFNTPT